MVNWNVLKDRKIIDIIIGDENINDDLLMDYKMPYMRKVDICEFGYLLDMPGIVSELDNSSRAVCMMEVIDFAIANMKINEFFKRILDLKRFKNVKHELYSNPQDKYFHYEYDFMNALNRELFYDKCHIEYSLETWEFNLVDDENEIILNTPNIENINIEYVLKLQKEIDKTIISGDYESTITKSRTMLEEVLRHGIELKNQQVEAKGNIKKLLAQFKPLYNMNQNSQNDKMINNLLSGIEKIIDSISEMRDLNSDSHGAGKNRFRIKKHHAILFANSSLTISEFLLSVIENQI